MEIQLARIQAVFDQALEIERPGERQLYLDRACAEAPELRQQVEALLRAYDDAGSFMQEPASAGAGAVNKPQAERPGTVIGPYKLLEQIGEGGFGIVFMAEQQHPVRRKVALKVLKPGMDTKQVVARFEAERQALALMNHPHIAHVFDGGETASGRPYFVMELVRGIPITDFCDQQQLPIRARLELFATVCQAVQHAHQKGIIHRDLKPSNLLVTLHDEKPVVKVIDFGIAKATGQQLTEKTLFTNFAQLIGTPLYMSPEQAQLSGLDIDTRSDIYSLGVMLYELLTATTPFDKERLRTATYEEIRRIIREEEPVKPSTRISKLGAAATTASVNRQSDTRRLVQLYRGELDWIVMKALEKDRNRRYESASALGADVQRYLQDEPVQACPPSLWYRFRKFARRKKGVLMAASAIGCVVLLAITGLAVSTALVWRANRELRQNLYYQDVALAEREWSANNLGRMEQLLEECPGDLRGWEWHYLKRLPHQSLPPLPHESIVLRVAFSPTGDCFASSSLDGVVKIWDTRTSQRLHHIAAHGDRVFALAFSPDGQRLASAGADSFIHIWDVRTGRRLLTWQGHKGRISNVDFSPDGRLLVSGGANASTETEENPGHEVKIWDAVTGELLRVLPGGTAVAFSPDGQRLASCGAIEGMRVWDTTTGRQLLGFPTKDAWTMIFSPDGRYLATANGDWLTRVDGEVTIWDSWTGKARRTLRGHTGFVWTIAFSPDGHRIASAGMDKTVKLWDVATGHETLTLRGPGDFIRSVAFSPDGRRLLAASEDRKVWTWDATPLGEQEALDPLTLHGHSGAVFGLAFHPDGRRLATASADGTAKIWDTSTGKQECTLPGRGGSFWSVAFSPDGQRLVVAGDHGQVGVWDTKSSQELLSIPGVAGPTLRVAFSSNGRFLACVGWDRTVRVCDAMTGLHLHSIRDAHKYTIFGLAISSDNRYIASAAVDDKVKIWDAKTGQAVCTLEPDHPGRPTSVAFRPDGRVLASASADGTIKLWDTQTWKEERELHDPMGGVECLAFSSDNRLLAWGSTDATVKIWNAITEQIETWKGHTSWVEAVAFSPDGKELASASLDGTVKLWPVASIAQAANAKLRLPAREAEKALHAELAGK